MTAPATTSHGEIVPQSQALARIQGTLTHESVLARISEAAVRGLDARHVASVALNVIRVSEGLQRCDPLSIAGALCQAAAVGLLPGNGLGHAYLVPRGGQCMYQIGFQGWRELAMRSGHVASIVSRCVYQGDEFRYAWGTDERIHHVPGARHGTDPALVTHVYAVARMRAGPPVMEVLPRDEVERIRAKSQASNRGPWVTDWAEMARKTAIIRLCKSLPRSLDMARALATEPDPGEPGPDGEPETLLVDQGESGEGIPPGTAVPLRSPAPPQAANAHPSPAAPSSLPANEPPDVCLGCGTVPVEDERLTEGYCAFCAKKAVTEAAAAAGDPDATAEMARGARKGRGRRKASSMVVTKEVLGPPKTESFLPENGGGGQSLHPAPTGPDPAASPALTPPPAVAPVAPAAAPAQVLESLF